LDRSGPGGEPLLIFKFSNGPSDFIFKFTPFETAHAKTTSKNIAKPAIFSKSVYLYPEGFGTMMKIFSEEPLALLLILCAVRSTMNLC
jgi:hypothetical protein